jgi:NAD-dependent dihydropyrimidine dehydrogenase PreA subunit
MSRCTSPSTPSPVGPQNAGDRDGTERSPGAGIAALTRSSAAEPAMDGERPKVRPSKVGKWRALSLLLVHVLVALHVWYFVSRGKTISPLEPSEAMQFSKEGLVNAGLIFFALTIVSTLVLGRWFCGWACHIVALQDGCSWILGKLGIRPRFVNLGILGSVPWIAFVYMFLVPVFVQLLEGRAPTVTGVNLYTSDFWKSFPSWPVAAVTIAVCCFGLVYFLGAKGFCNYGCPYGAIFGITDQIAPMRIRVTDACEGCGHCTAVCTSNVRVHEEVRDFKMVVDPGCMKCLDCVSVCPKDALYVGFGAPAMTAPRAAGPKAAAVASGSDATGARRGALARWALLCVFMAGSFAVFIGYNGEFGGFVNVVDWKLVATLTVVSFAAALVFKGKARRRSEYTLAEEALLGLSFLGAMFAFRGLHGWVPLLFCFGLASIFAWSLVQFLRLATRDDVRIQRIALKLQGKWRGSGVVFALVMVGVLTGFAFAARDQVAQREVAKASLSQAVYNRGVFEAQNSHFEEARAAFERALDLDPTSIEARENLAGVLCQLGRFADGVVQYERALQQNPNDADTHTLCARALMELGDRTRAIEHMREAVRIAPERAELQRVLRDLLPR